MLKIGEAMELGKLKTVALRKKWANEASDFTPWLANNIEELSKEIGIELEIENTEVAVGPYSADILAKDAGTGSYVIIENQLEKTNHDHLGKSITYASVLNASIIIWIASDFTEEHKKALDWLNDHTEDDLSFFGIQIELWQIEESQPAVKFNIISKPNLAVRQAAKSKTNEELSDNRKFQYSFWLKFRESLIASKRIPSVQTPRPQYWYDVSLGKANIHISNTCNTEQNIVGIRVYISNRIADSMLPFLENKKDEIESKIGQKLEWNPNPDNRDKVILLTHATDFNNEINVNEAIKWLTENTIKFREVFGPIIKDFK